MARRLKAPPVYVPGYASLAATIIERAYRDVYVREKRAVCSRCDTAVRFAPAARKHVQQKCLQCGEQRRVKRVMPYVEEVPAFLESDWFLNLCEWLDLDSGAVRKRIIKRR